MIGHSFSLARIQEQMNSYWRISANNGKPLSSFKEMKAQLLINGRAQKPSATFLEENVAWGKYTNS